MEAHELDDLINGCMEGSLSAAEAETLSRLLVDDAVARERYWKLAMVHAQLEQAMLTTVKGEAHATRHGARAPWVAAAACFALVGLGWHVSRAGGPSSAHAGASTPLALEVPLPQFATVSNASADAGFAVGRRVQAGPLTLDKGRVEVTFDCGAIVELMGPARLVMESEYRGFLHRGKLKAHVPPPAEGFIIQTPSSVIKDLGTSFGVEVADDGASEVHVLEGSVEASGISGHESEKQLVTQAQALRFEATSVEPATYDAERFRSELLPVSAVPRLSFTHWPLDTLEGDFFPDTEGKHKATPLALEPSPPEEVTPDRRLVDGRFGKALRFSGYGEYAATTHAGFAGNTPRTVAFWVQLPKVSEPGLHNCMLGWGTPGIMTKWEITWNQSSKIGTEGAPRLELGKGYVIGSTDLRDGQWHHVAIVYHGEKMADVSTHFKIYVDGRLDPLTGRKAQRISTDTTSPKSVPLTLGRYVDHRRTEKAKYFHGVLDELFVIEAALSPSEILTLMNANRLTH
jgi:hypothetical protein